ncbi:MAG: ATP-grasp domain-containing protein [Deltaproteobacteria bacterium]|nr:ATP-grasp domain-containing protein [Deltaproteobacteria bacterium]
MHREPVIVVGTTPDYVVKIHKKYSNAAVFILDEHYRGDLLFQRVDGSALLFVPLEDFDETARSVHHYISLNNLLPKGLACFDCESLLVAARLASALSLPYPSVEAVIHTRNKFELRRIWAESHIPCPRVLLVSSLSESMEAFDLFDGDIVLKPVSGSGSELLFHCRTQGEVKGAVRIMEEQLPLRKSNPLFSLIPGTDRAEPVNPCEFWIVEEFIPGPEFSCDFLLYEDHTLIVRETGKVKMPRQTFGSVLAYTFPLSSKEREPLQDLHPILERAARVLGYTQGHFMADFIVREGQVVLLEMTPRPGGNSIPDLLETAIGLDLIRIHLDMVSGKLDSLGPVPLPSESSASIHLYAANEGTITHLDSSQILSQPWVKALVLKKRTGDQITLPPNDYDNRLLGYCIVSTEPSSDLISIHRTLQRLLRVAIDA